MKLRQLLEGEEEEQFTAEQYMMLYTCGSLLRPASSCLCLFRSASYVECFSAGRSTTCVHRNRLTTTQSSCTQDIVNRSVSILRTRQANLLALNTEIYT
jgi:hypothetical protein